MVLASAKISVAIASFNGDSYIGQQLMSIIKQTLAPIEIIIVDDASTDKTIQVIDELREHTAIPIRLIKAPRNQGSTASFAQAIATCSGEWIALADQDDVWAFDKLEKLIRKAEISGWDAIFSDARFVDHNLNPMPKTLLSNSRLTFRMRHNFLGGKGLLPLLRYNVVTGATLMFRSQWRKLILPINPRWVHDYWIALLIASVGKIGLLEEELIFYRQHSNNQIGAKAGLQEEFSAARIKHGEQYLIEAAQFKDLREKLEATGYSQSIAISELKNKANFLHRRCILRRNLIKRIGYVLLNISQAYYFRYGQGWRPLLKDLFLP